MITFKVLLSVSTRHHKTVFTELGNYLTAFRLCNSRGRKIVERGKERKEKKRQSVAAKKRRPGREQCGIASSSTSICAAEKTGKN